MRSIQARFKQQERITPNAGVILTALVMLAIYELLGIVI